MCVELKMTTPGTNPTSPSRSSAYHLIEFLHYFYDQPILGLALAFNLALIIFLFHPINPIPDTHALTPGPTVHAAAVGGPSGHVQGRRAAGWGPLHCVLGGT